MSENIGLEATAIKDEKVWFVCNNCISELLLDDMGLGFDKKSGKIAHFCPECGHTEFTLTNEFDWEDEEKEAICENGPEEYFAYPEIVLKYSKHEFYRERHEQNLKKYRESKTLQPAEIEIWTSDVERFIDEFEDLNDCKLDTYDAVRKTDTDALYSLHYRIIGEPTFPDQTFYQIKNVFR